MAVFTQEHRIKSKLAYQGHICNLRVDEVQKVITRLPERS